MFRSAAKGAGAGQRIVDVAATPDGLSLLTLSEDGKVAKTPLASLSLSLSLLIYTFIYVYIYISL